MSLKQTEKPFLYLILLSILLHVGAYSLFSLIAPEPERLHEQTTMVELENLPEPPPVKPQPEPKPKPAPKPEPKLLAKPVPVPVPILPPQRALPVARSEAAPKAENKTERIIESKDVPNVQGQTDRNQQDARSIGKQDAIFSNPEKGGKESLRGEGFRIPKTGEKTELAKLFPSAKKMDSLEESYRKKYRGAEQGDTRMIDTDDPTVAVFSRKLLVAANDRFHLEQARANLTAQKVVVGVVMVTINRDGTVEDVSILESTRSKVVDDLTIKSIHRAGYLGPIPKKWPHEKLKLIWVVIPGNGSMAP